MVWYLGLMICNTQFSWYSTIFSWYAYHKMVLYHENSVLYIMRPRYHTMRTVCPISRHPRTVISWEDGTISWEHISWDHGTISWEDGTISWEQCTTYHETMVPHHDKMVLYDENRDRFIIAWQGKLASGKCPLRDPISTRLLGTFASGCGSCVSVRAWARTGGHWLCPCLCVCQANGCQSEHEKKVVGESLLYDCLVSPYCSGSYFSSV